MFFVNFSSWVSLQYHIACSVSVRFSFAAPLVDCIADHASSCLKIRLEVLGHIHRIQVLICADVVDFENSHLTFISKMIIHCHLVFQLQSERRKQESNGSFFLTYVVFTDYKFHLGSAT